MGDQERLRVPVRVRGSPEEVFIKFILICRGSGEGGGGGSWG